MARSASVVGRTMRAALAAALLTLGVHGYAAAHCDTLDGPVVADARKALEMKEATPVLKWVRTQDEKKIKAAFAKALAARGTKQQEAAEKRFFESLVRIHRAGEGAPFTGLKPAGQVEPAIAEADKALAAGSPDVLVKKLTDEVEEGIRHRYEKVAQAFGHKDESVEQGREFVAAYVEYTHYVERLHGSIVGEAHHGAEAGKEPTPKKKGHGH